MLKTQRHNEILEILKKDKFSQVSELSARLFVSQPTMRRDLNYLEKQGYVRRSHGGVMLVNEKINAPFLFRSGTRSTEKIKICKAAASLVSSDSLIFTDASSTALCISDYLMDIKNVTAVSNGLLACQRMSENGVQVYSTGGKLLKDSLAFVGKQAQNSVQNFNADIMFFSSSSLSSDGIISDYSEEETELRLAMLKKSAIKVFLCDSRKFDSVSAFNMCSLAEVDMLITDSPISEEIVLKYGFKLIRQEEALIYTKQISR